MAFKHFKHLNVPDSWERYFTKYPQGMSILEALFEWVSQVDNMVDNVNDWNTYLNNFVSQFDKQLQQTVTDTLTDWQESGFLDVVISEALQWELDNYIATNEADKLSITTQLQQTEQELSSQLAQKALESDLIIERNRINNLTNLAEGSTTGDAELTDIRVGADGKAYDTAGEAVRTQLTSVGGKISEINPKIQNKNFINGSEIVSGYWVDSTGAYRASESSKYIKIKVDPGENISFCRMDNVGYAGNTMGAIMFVDSAGNTVEIVDVISNIIVNGYAGYSYLAFDVPVNAKELHFTVKLSSTWDITSTAIVIKSPSFDNYDPNDVSVTSIYNNDIADIKARNDIKALQVGKYYSGIKWVAVGDSLTEVNSRATKNYVGYLTDELGFNVVNMGKSGTGYKRQDDVNNAFYQRILNVPTDADIVTIFGSFNDLGAGVPLGTKDDIGTDTLGGAINTTIDNLYSILPTVPLGIIAPTPWIDQDISNQSSTSSQYVQLLKDICYDRGIPFFDLFHSSGLRPWESEYRTLMYSRDDGNGVHPDENGHKLIAPKFAGLIKTLI